MKQTSVEYLVNELQKAYYIQKDDLTINYLIKKAKEMEKQQIIDADLNGSVRTANALDFRISPLRTKEFAEQYYNETFNK